MSAILVIVFFLMLSAIFSGMEIAFVSSNKFRIELNKENGTLSQRTLAKYNEEAPIFITSLLIGNNIALIFFSSLLSSKLDANTLNTSSELGLLVTQTILTTIIVLIFGEFLPKALFRISPYGTILLFSLPYRFLYFILRPIAAIFSKLSNKMIRKMFPNSISKDEEGFTSIDLEYYVKELTLQQDSESYDDDINSNIFEKALYLKETKVRECMVPRTELIGVEVDTDIEDLKHLFIESKHSRILVYKESLDHIIGYVHHIDLLKNPKYIKNILYDISVVPESMSARDLLKLFTDENKNIAYVVDEYGGTSGIVTLEDVIEEIFGEIQDEHDEDEFIEEKISESTYLFSGRLEIDYLNDKYNLDFPEGEYETLAGYVVVRNEDIPKENEIVRIDNYDILVVEAENNRLETLKLTVHEKEDD